MWLKTKQKGQTDRFWSMFPLGQTILEFLLEPQPGFPVQPVHGGLQVGLEELQKMAAPR